MCFKVLYRFGNGNTLLFVSVNGVYIGERNMLN
jgi:hypothetical protein